MLCQLCPGARPWIRLGRHGFLRDSIPCRPGLDTDDSDGFGGLDEQVSLETRTDRKNEPVEGSEAARNVKPDLEVDMTCDIEVTNLLRWEWTGHSGKAGLGFGSGGGCRHESTHESNLAKCHDAPLSLLVQPEVDRFMARTILLGKSELLLAVYPLFASLSDPKALNSYDNTGRG